MKKRLTNKLLLSALCIMIGVAPLVAFINTAESGKHMLKNEFGSNSILLSLSLEGSTAAFEDFQKLSEEIPEISAIIPISTSITALNSYKSDSTVTLKAVNHSYWKYAGLNIIKGSFITQGHLDHNLSVVVIDELTADELFGTTDVLGHKLETTVNGISFEPTIIGVSKRMDITEKQSNQGQGFAYIPITMLDNNLTDYNMQQVVLSIRDHQIEEAKAKVSHFLSSRDIAVKSEDIKLMNQLEFMDAFEADNKILLWAIAVLWFAAAILGITNIMLVDIERSKKYYGLLSFYGSSDRNIRNEVLSKAYAMALLCSTMSIVVGLMISFIVCSILNIPIYISVISITLGILIPIVVCLLSAIYPSYRASNIDVNSIIWQLE
ncbi:MAG: putative macrolide transporter permease protein [Clostridia bacterium]|nr:putative macrolide transporter permease protein [Clostridia bacterium]